MEDTRVLECPVCLGVFVHPCMLPCGHTFCEPCIGKLIRNQTVECPEDRKIHDLPPEGPKGFPVNYTVIRLLQTRCQQCHELLPNADCPHCKKRLCGTCMPSHDEYHSSQQVAEALQDGILCVENRRDELTDQIEGANIVLSGEVDKFRIKLHERIDDFVPKIKSTMYDHFDAQREWITDVATVVQSAKCCHEKATGTLGTVYQPHLSGDELKKIRKLCQHERDILDKSMDKLIQPSQISVDYDVEEIDKMITRLIHVRKTDSSPGFRKTIGGAVGKLGRLLHSAWSGRLKLMSVSVVVLFIAMVLMLVVPKEYGIQPQDPRVVGQKGTGLVTFTEPTDVTQCPGTGNIVVADPTQLRFLDADLNLIKTLNINSEFRHLFGRVGTTSIPKHVSCTTSGHVVVMTYDNHRRYNAIMFTDTGEYKLHLGHHWNFPSDVTANSTNMFVVQSNYNHVTISLFDLQGQQIHITDHEDIGMSQYLQAIHITTYQDHIILCSGGSVYYLTKAGSIVLTFKDITTDPINGLTVDTEGTLYLTSGNSITVVRDGVVIQRIEASGLEPAQLNGPQGLTVTTDNKLIVANKNNNHLLVYDLK